MKYLRTTFKNINQLGLLNVTSYRNSSVYAGSQIKSQIDSNAQSFKENYDQMKNLVKELNDKTKYVIAGGKSSAKAKDRHTSKGKLLARDRIKYLIDPKYVIFIQAHKNQLN
jgi:hypothetical protein